jgi:membrane protein
MELKQRMIVPFLKHLSSRFVSDACGQSASALTYMTLFAVVPVMTLMFSMFSVVPAFQGLENKIQALIFNHFLPQSGAEIQQYLTEFSNQARKLSILGAIILLVTSYLMLANIEKTFNKIWGNTSCRRGLYSFLLYWGVLSIGPLLIGIGLAIHAYLIAFQLTVNEIDALGIIASILKILPWLFTWGAFSFLFIAIPNCKISHRNALIGGLITSILFELAKIGFSIFISYSSYTNIYGVFAIFPIFLIWIYLMWIIVLAGAEIVRSLETFKSAWSKNYFPDFFAVLIILWECWNKQQENKTLSNKDMLIAGFEEQHWMKLRDQLLKEYILKETINGHYVLVRDLAHLKLSHLASLPNNESVAIPKYINTEALIMYPWQRHLTDILDQTNMAVENTFSSTVSELFSNESRQCK